jgi:chromosomal replication initiation ATPase DnaA
MKIQKIINPYIIPGIVTRYKDIDSLYKHMSEIYYNHFIEKSKYKTFDIFLEAVKSPDRHRELVKFRHIFWYISFKQLKLSYQKLSYYLNRDDHTSSRNGIMKVGDPISRYIYKLELDKFKHLL